MITREDIGRLVPGSILVGFVSASGVKIERRFKIDRATNLGGSIELGLEDLVNGGTVVCSAFSSGANLVFLRPCQV